MSEVLKECQLCHQMLPKEQFYKRKDRAGEPNWKVSYCKPCKYLEVNQDRKNNIDNYRKYQKEYSNEYYYNNKEKIKIIQKRYYYNKLSPEKQVVYKQKLHGKYPVLATQICK
jgi:hypothetical protein